MPVMKYDYDPYTGALVTTTEEGIVVTYKKGKQISSKTPSQVALEQQIISAGGTVTKTTEQQIALGLQEQVRSALKGETPGTFKVSTPEGSFRASSGITPEHLRGATGSQLKPGYKTVDGKEVPVNKKFTSSKGETINAVPIRKVGNEWIWHTSYGNVRATPERLQTELERKMMVSRITAEGQEIMAKKSYIRKESRTLTQRAEFLLEHPFKPSGYLIGSTILHGKPFALEGLRKYEKEREQWLETVIDTEDKTGLAFVGMVEPVSAVLGAKFIPGVTSFLSRSAVGTGIGLGVGAGLTTIGTIETVKGIGALEESQVGSGFLLATLGAGITKGIWEAGVVPELEVFAPKRKIPTESFTEIDVKSKKYLEATDETITGGKGKTKIISDIEAGRKIETEAEFFFDSRVPEKDFTWTEEVGGVKRTLIEDTFFGAKRVTELAPVKKFIGMDATVPFPEAGEDFFLSGSGAKIEGGEMVEGARVSRKMFQKDDVTVFFGKGESDVSVDTSLAIVTDPFLSDPGVGSGSGTDLQLSFKPLTKVDTSLRASHKGFVESFLEPKVDQNIAPIIPGTGTKTKQETISDLEVSFLTEAKTGTEAKQEQFLQLSPIIEVVGDQRTDQDTFLGSASIQAFDTLSTLDQDQDSFLKLDTGARGTPGLFPEADPFITPEKGIPFGILWPDWELKEDSFLKPEKGSGKRKFASAPSFLAMEWDVRGKMPKFITGIGVRPLPKGKKRRKVDPFLEVVF